MSDPDLPGNAQWPPDGLEPVPTCPICGSPGRRVLHAGLVDDTFFTAPGKWTLQQCDGCGSAYLDPRPTRASIGRAYADYYTHGSQSGVAPSGVKALLKRALRLLSHHYAASLARSPQESGAPGEIVAGTLVKAFPAYRELIDAEYRHLRRPQPGADRLLDLGCGAGEFLVRARFLGWNAEGVDFDPKAVATARARGLNVSVGSIESYAQAHDVFDVVTCNHVIEHVYDPCALLDSIHRILKPGGRLWIETPNINSAGHALFGRAWRGLEAPRHIAIFSHRALVDAVMKAGFVITHLTPWNIQHIRMVFACSEAIEAHGDPHNTRTPLLPNARLRRGLWTQTWSVDRREFVCLRATKRGG
jgi:2-polyprenyl-3-methyl-5-hydroxy-6-metoxy-1,4-benzoquinol methylase